MENNVATYRAISTHMMVVRLKGVLSALIGLTFAIVAATGIILLNAPTGRYARLGGWSFAGLTRWDLRAIHDYAGLAMMGLILIHVLLNWNLWTCEVKALLHRNK
ncbi:DUF4405 domain-containing protein [Coprothermobacteraceae bacterium]|nr:DUF4405 domain-containing protein [Coprothermobacteraceae bacterium]